MSATRVRVAGVAGMLVGLLVLAGWSFAQRENDATTPESLLPADSVLYFRLDGSLLHEEAFRETAAYEALYSSGLVDVIEKVAGALAAESQAARLLADAFLHVREHGLSVAIAVNPAVQGPPIPWGMIVVNDAADGGPEAFKSLLEEIPDLNLRFEEMRLRGRSVQRALVPMTPAEICAWSEGKHLVIAFGIDAIASAVAVAEKDRENITAHPLWERYAAADVGFHVASLGWLDFNSLKETFGPMPVPLPGLGPDRPILVNDVVKALGLDTFHHLAVRSGYRGRSQWSEVVLHAPGERTDLMALAHQKPITLEDLPPIPAGSPGFVVSSFDWGEAYGTVLESVHQLADLGPPGARDDVEWGLRLIEQELGFRPQMLLESLGHVNCAFNDARHGILSLGMTLLVSVEDARRLTEQVEILLDRIRQQAEGNVRLRKIRRHGRAMTLIEFPQVPVVTPALCIDEDWIIVGLVSQSVEATLLRMEGKLPAWTPEGEVAAALEELPEEFTSLTVVDPRGTYEFLLGFAPSLLGILQVGLRESGEFPPDFELPVSAADVPPTELVLAPLYPNVTVTAVDGDGTRSVSRRSVAGLPLFGGAEAGTTVATTGVLVALLLPAVQQARTAARMTQSRNNLKQIALSLHNHHDVAGTLPAGTVPNADLEPEERLSWMVSILPHLDQAPLYERIDKRQGWEADANGRPVGTLVPVFVHPGEEVVLREGQALSHYVGIGGVGADAPTLPVDHRRAGTFGYDRPTSFRDVRDGTSNTMGVSEANEYGPWAAGGRATVRALTKKPYVNGPDGVGSPLGRGAVNVMMLDGSVRSLPPNVDPAVLEALSTINGGEVVDPF